jgi:D-alanyl-D-alanine carboxypeptidase (penicillin-binding protein 5/6)
MLHKKLFDFLRYASVSAIFLMLITAYYRDVSSVQKAEYTVYESSFFEESMPIDISARSAVVCDAFSGDVIYSKNPDEKLPMASTTKIMTALVVIENCDLSQKVEISDDSVGIEGSSIYLSKGEILTVGELLYGLLLESGNDAAHALALHTGKTAEGFCDMMNKKASELSLSSTNFENPHGLSAENHYTTARELAAITSAAMKNDTFRKIVSTEKYHIPERENCRERYFSNHNRLLKSMDDCIGVKTGYTKNSGRCLVSATDDGTSTFVVVTLNDRNDFADHKQLHSLAQNSFKSILVAKKDELKFSLAGKEISNRDDIYITVKKDFEGPISMNVTAGKNSPSDVFGTVKINFDGLSKSFHLYTYDSITQQEE